MNSSSPKLHAAVSVPHFFGCMLAIAIAAYFLAPSAWEPGAESFKHWVSARIFRETGGFPVLHHGPLYNLYLQFFLCFPYPLSIRLEHTVTHLVTYSALLLLLRRFLPPWASLLLLCAWIPALWVVEGGARIAGMGCFALYLAADSRSRWLRGWLPVPLLVAALFDAFYLPFLGGHVIGTAVLRLWRRQPLWTGGPQFGAGTRGPWLAKIALMALVVVTAAFQSPRADNNVHGFEYPWAPVPLHAILTAGSIQVGNWKYVMSHYPESEWMYKDWYETNAEAFGGAQTLLGAIRHNPGFYLQNILFEAKGIISAPPAFLIGFRAMSSEVRRALVPALWLLLALSAYWVLRWLQARDELAKAFAMAAGTAAAAVVFSLVYVNTRFMMPFLPLGLLATAHVGPGLQSLGALWRRRSLNDLPYPAAPSALTLGVVCAVALLAFTAVQPLPWAQPGNFLERNPYALRGHLWQVNEPLLNSLGRGKRVLAAEEAWIRTFADVDLDTVYHPLYLPPFADITGDTARFLAGLDVIWISNGLAQPAASIGTQTYLRYKLHLEPFLKRAEGKSWAREEVPGFGQIYRRTADPIHR